MNEPLNPSYAINATEEFTPIIESDEVYEMSDDFDFEGFEVVRREFFAHLREPAITFNNSRIYVNSACLTKFPDTQHVQVVMNPHTRIMGLRPCAEGVKDSFPWCYIAKDHKKKPKQITCPLFLAKVFTLMQWAPEHRYKLLGNIIHANGEYLLAFDLSSSEVYVRTQSEDGKSKASRTLMYPASWQNQFGIPFYEHQQAMQINLFDGYAIYSVKDNTVTKVRDETHG